MSAVATIAIRLDWSESNAWNRVQTVSEGAQGLVDGRDYVISGTPDQLLDLAALLIDAANLVYAAQAEAEDDANDDGLTWQQSAQQRQDEINARCVVCDDKGCVNCREDVA